jgi:Fungal specific transcription factor domain
VVTLSRADFCFSSTWRMPLAFPLLPGLSQSLPTSDQFISEMVLQYKLFGPSDISEPSLCVSKVLTLLQSISQTISVFPDVGGDRVVISNSIYVAEHQLLSLTFPRGDLAATGLDISECLRIAALLYLHLAIREWPLRAQRHCRLVESLLRSLPHDWDLSTLVAPEMGLYLLLWAHFVGAAAAIEPQSRAFLAAKVSQVTAAARITNYADFERGLKTVAWTDPFCRLRCIELWDEI